MNRLAVGLKGIASLRVTPEVTAARVASGALDVFATPQLIALSEKAAFDSVQPLLDSSETTVGTNVTIDHLAATPLGMKVQAETTLSRIDKKFLHFDVVVKDEVDVIGRGTHSRFVLGTSEGADC
ncbi:thioesterase family protein [Hyaloraphidium curvatum]|nr:thioesterase family protein [Hyaloraphidium curvatum]